MISIAHSSSVRENKRLPVAFELEDSENLSALGDAYACVVENVEPNNRKGNLALVRVQGLGNRVRY